jgi:pimeloyl-ACP methyl ester carboxylesterase
MRGPLSLAVIAVVLVGCGGQVSTTADPATAPATPTSAPSAAPETSLPSSAATPLARDSFEVEVGGLTIHGHCAGAEARDPGEPAVLLAHGNGGNQRSLLGIEEYMANETLVCSYDRPGGGGRSDRPADRPRPVADVVSEARGVLAAAGVEPPFFLIGHSAGGVIASMLAHRHPDEVVGFVIDNPNPPFSAWMEALDGVVTQQELDSLELPDFMGDNPEGIDMRGNDAMLEPLPDAMPFAVLFDEDCTPLGRYCDKIWEPLKATQALAAEAGAGGRFVYIEGAGHEIPDTEPDAMRAVVEEVWAEATGQP